MMFLSHSVLAAVFTMSALSAEVSSRPDGALHHAAAVVDQSPVFDDRRKGDGVHFYQKYERGFRNATLARVVKEALNHRDK